MGTGVLGGMLLATFVATIFIPLFFTWLSNKNVHRKHHELPPEDTESAIAVETNNKEAV
jgi:multidrug efflux pump